MNYIKRYYTYIICVAKLFLAYICVIAYKKHLYKKNIWLIQEKHTEARDNGYFFFKYLRTTHPELNVFFSITTDSVDKKNVEIFGNIIKADSLQHYIYYLSAKYNIGSQPFGACPHPVYWVHKFKFLCRKDQKVIFLQHGVIKDAINGLKYSNTHFDLFTCSAVPEYKFVCDYFGYSPYNAKLLGLCRYDNLHNFVTEKKIIVMPTFRKWLTANNRECDATNVECEKFKQSVFFKYYSTLLSDKSLFTALSEHDYQLIFYLHYSLQSYTKVFDNYCNNNIIIASRNNYNIQELLKTGAVLVTDYSSVAFDFAYMEKPVIYFQFDEDDFRSMHYQKGYFDYHRDGFGPVFKNVDDVVDHLIKRMDTDYDMENPYKQRAEGFFTLRDSNNCLRHYEAIIELK